MASISAALDSSRFRLLNELLYTQPSGESHTYFADRHHEMQVYHDGFSTQTNKWPFQPIKVVQEFIEKNKDKLKDKYLIDLGCGEGKLEENLRENHIFKIIKSYDLVSLKPHIIARDIRSLPEKDSTVDVAVFCLSLMGTNYIEFLYEANRYLIAY